MHKRTLLLFVAGWIGLASPVMAGIKFDWSRSSEEISSEKRQQIEALVHRVAALFLQPEYADLGAFDFESHPRSLLIQVRDFGEARERGLHLTGAIYLNQRYLDDLKALEVILVHEMTHAYDFFVLAEMMVDYLTSPESGDARAAHKVFDQKVRKIQRVRFESEKRANRVMMMHARSRHLPVPEDLECGP